MGEVRTCPPSALVSYCHIHLHTVSLCAILAFMSSGVSSVMKHFYIACALILGFVLPALAQVQGGSITGTVTDVQGGMMSDVAVTLQGPDISQTFTTATDGRYRFLDLAPGSYMVKVAHDGFTTI